MNNWMLSLHASDFHWTSASSIATTNVSDKEKRTPQTKKERILAFPRFLRSARHALRRSTTKSRSFDLIGAEIPRTSHSISRARSPLISTLLLSNGRPAGVTRARRIASHRRCIMHVLAVHSTGTSKKGEMLPRLTSSRFRRINGRESLARICGRARSWNNE